MSSAVTAAINLYKSGLLQFSKGLTLSQMISFRLFQTERADDNFKLDENSEKFSKWVENAVGKGEIANY